MTLVCKQTHAALKIIIENLSHTGAYGSHTEGHSFEPNTVSGQIISNLTFVSGDTSSIWARYQSPSSEY